MPSARRRSGSRFVMYAAEADSSPDQKMPWTTTSASIHRWSASTAYTIVKTVMTMLEMRSTRLGPMRSAIAPVNGADNADE
jgi:hypothetical protein